MGGLSIRGVQDSRNPIPCHYSSGWLFKLSRPKETRVRSSSSCSCFLLVDIQTEGVSLVTGLHANSSIPYSVILNIVEHFNNMAGSPTSFYRLEFWMVCQVPVLIGRLLVQWQAVWMKNWSVVVNLLIFSSCNRIDSYFADHPLLDTPEPVHFVPQLESHYESSGFVYDQFQYVSVKKTLTVKPFTEQVLCRSSFTSQMQTWSLPDFADEAAARNALLLEIVVNSH